jgi:hypothetical protein
VKYLDPDGRIQVSSDGSYIFYVEKDSLGNPITIHIQGNSGKTIEIIEGYLLANDGTKINAFYNLSRETAPEDNYDCHGYTFSKGTFWINNQEVEKILIGDGYQKTTTPQKGDILVQRNKDGEIYHSARIIEVDEERNRVKVEEAMESHLFTDKDGNKYKLRAHWYELDNTRDTVYSAVQNKVGEL